MSTSLLYHASGIRGYRHVRTRYREGGICFGIELPVLPLLPEASKR